MANQTSNPLSVERNAHVLMLGSLIAAFLIAGAVTKNERAVFLTEGTGLPAKAFAAAVPVQQSQNGQEPALARGNFSPSDLSDLASGRRLLPRRPIGQTGNGAATNPNSIIPSAPLVLNDGAAGPAALTEPSGSGLTELASLAPAQFAPSIPQSSAGGGGGTPAAGGGSDPAAGGGDVGPADPATPAPPVAVVPEPSTWAMLLAGFFAIGIALRRRMGATVPIVISDRTA